MYIMLLAHSLCPRHIFKCKLGCDSGDAKGAVRRPSEPSPRGTPPSRPRRTYSLLADVKVLWYMFGCRRRRHDMTMYKTRREEAARPLPRTLMATVLDLLLPGHARRRHQAAIC